MSDNDPMLPGVVPGALDPSLPLDEVTRAALVKLERMEAFFKLGLTPEQREQMFATCKRLAEYDRVMAPVRAIQAVRAKIKASEEDFYRLQYADWVESHRRPKR